MEAIEIGARPRLTKELVEHDLEGLAVGIHEFAPLAQNELFVNRREHRLDDGRLHQAGLLPLGEALLHRSG